MEKSNSIFWGLVVKPNKRYDTTVQEPFRVTKACIEPSSAGDKVTSVYVECDNAEEFIIANLDKKHFESTLDLAFTLGEKIAFKTDGPGTIHLTGTILEDDEDDGGFDDSFLDNMSEGEEEELSEAEDVKTLKRKKVEAQGSKAQKKAKLVDNIPNGKSNGVSSGDDSDDDDSEEDSDDDDSEDDETGGDTTLGDLDSTNNFAEEEDSDDDDDDDDDDSDEDDDDSDDDDSDDSEEVKFKLGDKKGKPASPAVNGTPKKGKLEPAVKKDKSAANTPKSEGKKEVKTPKSEQKSPKAEQKSPKTPKVEQKSPKTPKVDAKTPKTDAKTPKSEAAVKTPKAEALKTPNSSKGGVDTPSKTPKRTVKGGIQIEELKEGSGPECKPGSVVGMFYSGRLKTNNKQFDSCLSGKPFKFKLGKGEVIKGWDIGVQGLKVGGKRRLTLPPAMAYGSQGAPPDIPPNSTLVFEVECKFVN